jgi:A/G-specific adenine glycosylase
MNLKGLIQWSEKEFPDLPWRQNRSLYRTLVSEIMLQQTTVGTVKNHFERFLKRFPDLDSLAKATEEELLIAWKGLGYYRRAKNLKKIAQALASDHEGDFPHDLNALMEISGIGPYTASALVGIGMDKRALAVDANLERVIARLFNLQTEKGPKLQKEIQKLFHEKKIFQQKFSFRKLNEALMDLGRTYCQARKASCELCPLKKDCKSFSTGEPLKLPRILESKSKKEEHEIHLLRIYVIKHGKLLVYKKIEGEWLSGQYEVPTFVLKSTDKKLSQYPNLTYTKKLEITFKTGITKYKIENKILELDEKEFKKLGFSREVIWLDAQCEKSNLTTATIKGLKLLTNRGVLGKASKK